MRLMTSMLDRVLDSLAFKGKPQSRRARKSAMQRAVLDALEPRVLMNGTLELFWVQTGIHYRDNAGDGTGKGGDGSNVQVTISGQLDYDRHWVAAYSPEDAARILFGANNASITTPSATQSSYDSRSVYSGSYPLNNSQTSNYWEVGPGAGTGTSDPAAALNAYGGYLDAAILNPYEINVPILAPGVPNYCLPCNGVINPGLIDGPNFGNGNLAGQASLFNATPGGAELSTLLSTHVWGTGTATLPDKTVGELMGGGNQDIQLLNAAPAYANSTTSQPQYMVAFSPSYVEIFARNGSSGFAYSTTMGGSQDTLVFNNTTSVYTLTDADGKVFTFGGTVTAGIGAGLTNGTITDSGGHITTLNYNSSGSLQSKTLTLAANTLQKTSYTNYYEGTTQTNLVASVIVQNSTNNGSTGSWGTLTETGYTYTNDSNGQPQLSLLTVHDSSGNVIDQTGYGYYLPGDSKGREGAIKFAFGTQAMARLNALGLSPSGDDSLLPYADVYYQYDPQGRISKQVIQSTECSACFEGVGTYTFSYGTSGNSGTLTNAWTNKASETTPQGEAHTVYVNGSNEPILDVVQSDAQTWVNYYRYDDQGHQILHANPSAMIKNGTRSYDESLPDLVGYSSTGSAYIADNSGFLDITGYYAQTDSGVNDTTAGGVAGQTWFTAEQEGELGGHIAVTSLTRSGTITTVLTGSVNHGFVVGNIVTIAGASDSGFDHSFVITSVTATSFTFTVSSTLSASDSSPNITVLRPNIQDEMTYFQHTATEISSGTRGILTSQIATSTVFINADQTGGRTTSYAYNWLPNANSTTSSSQIGTIVTTLPTVSTANNGPGTSNADTSAVAFDSFGRTIWTEDGGGFGNYTEYDALTGAVTKTIVDASSSQLPSTLTTLLNNASVAYHATGLNLTTTYQFDSFGRMTKQIDPNGQVTFTIYDDSHHAVFTIQNPVLTVSGTIGTLTLTLPITLTRTQLFYSATVNGVTQTSTYDETLTFSGTLGIATSGTLGVMASQIVLPGWNSTNSNLLDLGSGNPVESLGRSIYDEAGHLVESDSYLNIDNSTYLGTSPTDPRSGVANVPGSDSSTANYYATTYAYDGQGRLWQTTSPTGTISETHYDDLGREVATFVGTSTTNLRLVSSNEYDFGGVGDGNLTATIQYPGNGASPRATQYLYDWRDRQISAKSGVITQMLPVGNDGDIGSPSQPGSASFDGAAFTLASHGTGMGSTSDQFNFLSTSRSGDTTFVARVTALSGPINADGGIMIRNGSGSGAAYADIELVNNSGSYELDFVSRAATNGTTTTTTVSGVSSAVWLKLARTGNIFEAFYSDGSSWIQIGATQSISMSTSVLAGMFVAGSNSTASASFTSLEGIIYPSASLETDNVHRPVTVSTLDNLGETLVSSRYDGDGTAMVDTNGDGVPDGLDSSTLRANSSMNYDEQGRLFKSTTFNVSPSSGTYSTTTTDVTISESWFDHRGDQIASYTTGGAMNKQMFDGAGRVTASFTTDGGAVGNSGTIRATWSDANSVNNDIVLQQTAYQYDVDSNVILTTTRQAFDGNASTGQLLTAGDTTGYAARVSYAANYYDAANRLIESVNAGTNGGVLNGTASGMNLDDTSSGIAHRPATMPSLSATANAAALITTYSYDAAGNMNVSTDSAGIVAFTIFDPLGRQTETIANYLPATNSGNPTDSANQSTLYTYDGSNHVLTLTAKMPSGQTDQTTAYVYNLANASSAGYVASTAIYSNDLLWATQYPDKVTGTASTNTSDIVITTYDALGETLTKLDRNGVTHSYSYDVLGRLTLDGVTQTLSLTNGDFENQGLSSGAHLYNATNSSWTLMGDSGIAHSGAATNSNYYFGSGYSGSQVAFLQTLAGDTSGSMTQTFSVAIGGSYQINFNAAQQNTTYPQTVEVDVDGISYGAFKPTSTTFAQFTTDPFTIPSGSHTLTFKAIAGANGTNSEMALVDYVTLNYATTSNLTTISVGDSGFQNQTISGSTSVYNATASSWTFHDNAGLVRPRTLTAQWAFLQTDSGTLTGVNGSMDQTVHFNVGGTYMISFSSINLDDSISQSVNVSVDGTVVGSFTPDIATESDVTDAFFVAQGDHVIKFAATADPANGACIARVDNVSLLTVTQRLGLSPVLSIGSSYNSQGLPYQVTSYSGSNGSGSDVNQIQNVYNGFDQLTQQYQDHAGAVNTSSSMNVQYGYSDGALGSRLTQITYPSGQVLCYNYSSNGTGSLNDVISRLDNLVGSDANGGTATLESYKYLGLATVVERNHSQSGINLTYIGSSTGDAGDKYMGLDRFGRVVDQKWVDANNSNAVVDEYQYAYDHDSNVTSKINVNNTTNNETYTYDGLNRLASMTRNGTANNYQSFGLDALGNITTQTNGTSSALDRTYSSQNELIGFETASGHAVTLTFDNNGNTITDEQGHVQVYDAWNRLLTVNDSSGSMLAAYAYDGAGRRITETPNAGNPNELYYSATGQVMEEDINASGLRLNVQNVWSPVYQNGLVLRDDKYTDSGTFNREDRVYALQDANYNVTALVTAFTFAGDTNANGVVNLTDLNTMLLHWDHNVPGGDAVGDINHDGKVNAFDFGKLQVDYNRTSSSFTWQVTERLIYDAYGKFTTTVRDNTGTWNNTWGDYLGWNITFQGGRWNALTRQVEFGLRQEDVDTGRWTTPEPSGADPYVDGMNLYPFAAGNPINSMDPTGTRRFIFVFEGLWGYGLQGADDIASGKGLQSGHGGNVLKVLVSRLPIKFTPGGSAMHSPDCQKDMQATVLCYYPWEDADKAIAYAASMGIGKPFKLNNKDAYDTVEVIGHSFGGDSAWKFASRLKNEMQVTANLGITFDPRSNQHGGNANGFWTTPGMTTNPANTWLNYYRTMDLFLPGHELPVGAGNQWRGWGYDHIGMVDQIWQEENLSAKIMAVGTARSNRTGDDYL